MATAARSGARDGRLALAVFASGVALLAPGVFFGLPPSRGIAGADVVLQGGVPYRDFWTMYAPAQFYLIAALFRSIARELVVQGIAAVLLDALAGAILFRIARRLGASAVASVAVALAFVLSLFRPAVEITSYSIALPAMLGAILCALRYLHGAGARELFAAGALAGLAATSKHDVGAYAAIGIGAGLAVAWFLAGARRDASWMPPVSALARLAAGALAVVLPIAFCVAWSAGLDAWRDLIAFPAGDFRAIRKEAWPGLLPGSAPWGRALDAPSDSQRWMAALAALSTWLRCNVPQWTFVAGVVVVASLRKRLEIRALASACVLLASLPCYWWAAHTQQNTHLISMAALSLLLAALAWTRSPRSALAARTALAMATAIYVGAIWLDPLVSAARLLRSLPRTEALELDGARWIQVSRREARFYREIVRFVQANVPVEEPIYVGVARHDAVVVNNQRVQYLCGRRGATRYNELHAGIADRGDVQREIIDSIESKGVRCAILLELPWGDARFDQIRDKHKAAVPECGSTLLDDYLRAQFEPKLRIDEYTILWRKDAALR
jgi:hypothetical protein